MSIFTPESAALLYPMFKFQIEDGCGGKHGCLKIYVGNGCVIEQNLNQNCSRFNRTVNEFINNIRMGVSDSLGFEYHNDIDTYDEFCYDASSQTFKIMVNETLTITIPLEENADTVSQLCEELTKIMEWVCDLS